MVKIKTKVVHSTSKTAWNVVGTGIGDKFKIAICPYVVVGNQLLDVKNQYEALEHAEFISKSFNNA